MYEDDITKYRKKSQHRPPKKSDHKHNYQPCILRAPVPSFDKVHGRVPIYKLVKATYCTICGKIENFDIVSFIVGNGMTKEASKLPTFTVEDLFTISFVNLKEK